MRRGTLILIGWTMLATGCEVGALPSPIGTQCDLNSDCDAPLVCRWGRCRRECAVDRDCALGFDCLVEEDGLGGCQVEAEVGGCERNSDCESGLLCVMGECTTECGCPENEPCRDCGGRVCVRVGGVASCFNASEKPCVYNSDCGPDQGFSCLGGRCGTECEDDLDCAADGRVCATRVFEEPGGAVVGRRCEVPGTFPPIDAGR
ncbi:MAG TPA: Dickkopf N-terminal cysteine-rich domain-containing protein [Sandaracinaceae bacterium LLY-WYZ-13_1]|nr:Dickkopf N-terminal cysteine-rich domain-containing protein [Sandaracinaceae bacterium LLY-WYZ-13_1]